MNQCILSILMVFGLSSILIGQEFKEYTFEGDYTVGLKVVDADADECKKTHLFIGGHYNYDEDFLHIGVGHYQPKMFDASVTYSVNGIFADASVFFKNKVISSTISPSVKRESFGNTKTRYVIEVPSKERISYGLHLRSETITIDDFNILETQNISVGITRLKAKHTHWKIKYPHKTKIVTKQGTAIFKFHADVSFFTKRMLNSIPDSDIDNYIRPIVPRIYSNGLMTIWGRSGAITLHYTAGIQLPYLKDTEGVNGYIFGGFGFGLLFN